VQSLESIDVSVKVAMEFSEFLCHFSVSLFLSLSLSSLFIFFVILDVDHDERACRMI
jgi:hypothetical protein